MPKFSSNGIITASLNDVMRDFESLISRTRDEDSTLPVVPAPGNTLPSVQLVTNEAFDSTINVLMPLLFSKADLNCCLSLCPCLFFSPSFLLPLFFSFPLLLPSFVPPEYRLVSGNSSNSHSHFKFELHNNG